MKLECDPECSQNTAEDRLGFISCWEKIFLVGYILVWAGVEIRTAALRSLWFDELSTLIVSSAPTVKQMFHAIPVDGNPPLYFLLARCCLHLPISTEIALRLPSIVAISISALTIYLFVRRNASSIFAFLAISIFLSSSIGRFAAIEARPYALLLCFTGIAILSWQYAARGRHRRLALAGITVATAGAIFSHQYGIIYVTLPLLAGEFARFLRHRGVDLAVLVSMLLGATAIAVTFPPMLHAQSGLLQAVKHCPDFWARPGWRGLLAYLKTVPVLIPVLLVVAGVLWAIPRYGFFASHWRTRKRASTACELHMEDLAVSSMLALILPVMLLATKLGTGYFMDRYAVGSALGVALISGLLFSCLNNRLPEIETFVPVAIIYCFLVAFIGFWFVDRYQESAGIQSDPLFLAAPAGEPIVIADAVLFWPTWWYSNAQTRARLHYLADLDYAVNQPDFIPEYTLTLERPFGAPKLDDYRGFLRAHREFLLYCYGMPRLEWVKDRLRGDGWHLMPIRSEGRRELYRVIAPPSIANK